MLLRCCLGVVKVLSRCCQGVVKVLSRCCQGVVKVLLRCCEEGRGFRHTGASRGPPTSSPELKHVAALTEAENNKISG